jgi:hypothetical protein
VGTIWIAITHCPLLVISTTFMYKIRRNPMSQFVLLF